MSLELAIHHYALDLLSRADMDYISARHNYRLGFTPPFLWSSQQSIEKYLKAAILVNGGSLKLTHDTYSLWETFLDRVLVYSGLPINYPKWMPRYIHHLSVNGVDRYGSNEVYQMMHELFELDEAVWTIRRYCISHTSFNDGRPEAELSRMHLENVQQYFTLDRKGYFPQPFIYGGLIEEVLRDEASSMRRKALTFANWYFSPSKRFRGKLTMFSASRIAVHQRSAVKQFIYPSDDKTIDRQRASQLEKRLAFPHGSLVDMIEAHRKSHDAFNGDYIRKNTEHVTPHFLWVIAHPFTGNSGTKSLHRYGCKHIEKILEAKKRSFDSLADALDANFVPRCKCNRNE